MPPEWNACARQSRVCPCYTTWCAPIIRCRSASLAVVRPNHRLSKHSTMRRASAMLLFRTQSAAEKTSLAPHDSKARLLDMSKRRDSWRSHVHRTRLRSACSSSSLRPAMCGVEGEGPSSFLLGDLKGDILFLRKRISPFNALPHGAGAPPPRSARRYNLFPYMKRSHLSMPLYNLRFLSAKRP